MERHGQHRGLLLLAALPAALVLMPLVGLLVIALRDSGAEWEHLARHVLPDALWQTVQLLLGTSVVAGVVGVGTAWLVTAFRFPGRAWLEWALVLPLAMPTYILAYSYIDVLHPIGPVQSALRAALGIQQVRGLILPDIRSMGGCILIMGFALYPYVYLTTRAALMVPAAEAIDAARGMGARGWILLWRVTLPMAAAAIGAGLGLAAMEVLADVGASEFLGVRTLTVAVYVTWTTRGSVEGAAQIALSMLVFTVALITLERAQAQRKGRGAEAAGQAPSRQRLRGGHGWVAFLACLAPVLLGFAVPALHLVVNAAIRVAEFGLPRDLPRWIWSSTWLAMLATVVTVTAGFAVAFVHRQLGGTLSALLGRIAALGYALPGTVLAVGLLGPMGWLDEGLFRMLGAAAPAVSGSAAALVLAYAVRFMAMPVNTLEAAYGRMPVAMDDAARGLGARHRAVVWRIHLPLLAPATAASAILVLIESMKELPATLLLRPLNVETLATAVYAEASRGTYEDGAVAALAIVLVSLLPVMVLVRGLRAVPVAPLRDAVVVARA